MIENVVVYNKHTKEVLAIISDKDDCIVHKDVGFKVFNGSEPILYHDDNGKVYFDDNSVILHTRIQ